MDWCLAAAEDQAWPEVQRLSSRLVDRFPVSPPRPTCSSGWQPVPPRRKQWPIARSSYERALALNRSVAPDASGAS